MSPAEVGKLLAVVAAAYPGFEVDEIKHRLWLEMLGDLDYQTANAAVKMHITLSRFAPTVAEIREQARFIAAPDEPTAAEAWQEFIGAVKRYTPYGSNAHLAELNPIAREVGECMGWRDSAMSENIDVLRGQFMRMFEQLKDRRRRLEALPDEYRLAIEPGRGRRHLEVVGEMAALGRPMS